MSDDDHHTRISLLEKGQSDIIKSQENLDAMIKGWIMKTLVTVTGSLIASIAYIGKMIMDKAGLN